MTDQYRNEFPAEGPARSATEITPNDTTDLTTPTRGIYLGASGNVKVDMVDSGTVTFSSMAAGMVHPLRVKRIYATGTTATSIIGVY